MTKKLFYAALGLCFLAITFGAAPVFAADVDGIKTGMYFNQDYNSSVLLNENHTFSASIGWGEFYADLSGTWRSVIFEDTDPPIAIILTVTDGDPSGQTADYTLSTYPGLDSVYVQDGTLGIMPADTELKLSASFEHGYSPDLPQTGSETGGQYVALTIDLNNKTYKTSSMSGSFGTPAPFIDEYGNTLIPVRFLSEASLTGPVHYDEASREVTISFLDRDVILRIGSPQVTIDNGVNPYTLTMIDVNANTVSPRIINGYTYLPLRSLLTTALEYVVDYSGGVVTVYGFE